MNGKNLCEQLGHYWGDWEFKEKDKPLIRRCLRCGEKQERGHVGRRTPRIIYHPRMVKA